MRATTNLFIGIESNANLSMLYLGMRLQVCNSCYNLSNTCLVISTKQSVSVGNNDIIALIVLHLGKIRYLKHNTILFIKKNIATSIIFHHARLYILTAHVRACIKMGNKTYNRHLIVAVRRKSSIKITLLIEYNILKSHIFQLLFKITCKNKLTFSCRNNCSIVTRFSIECHILEKTLKHIFLYIFHISFIFLIYHFIITIVAPKPYFWNEAS